ncbi:DinB family protein [Runella aurantiaca]|uniref:DinB family protein n=1 Tax=Runella aurantiaca TaxID=2282308 RepID=A0A369I673_9BACT|nr:DinB family protein [Runella aurantiaca]RDB03967.1 DinB family protein [Runella aurantiaca]
METLPKEQLLNSLEHLVDGHLQQAIRHFQNMTAHDLLQPAYNGGWSIAQCLDHLNSYGHYYLPKIQQGIAKNIHLPPKDTFKSSWLGAYFIKMMDPETGKKKYKAFKGHIPAPDLDAYAVVAEFIQQQENLLIYLKEARSTDLNAIRIPISIARFITLKLGDVFQFVIAHNERHIRQAMRNVTDINKRILH